MSFRWGVAAALLGALCLWGSVAAAKIERFKDSQGILHITNAEEGEQATLPASPVLKGPRNRIVPPPSPPPPPAEPAAIPPGAPPTVTPEASEVAPAPPQPEAPPEAGPAPESE